MSTPSSPIDIVILASFLIATLILGIQAGRKVNSFRAYAIGNKDFSTATLTATIIATWIGGGFLFYALANIYTSGLRFMLVTTGGTLCLLFTGQVLAERMGAFLNYLSVAEAMGDLYGPVVRVITGVSGILGRLGGLAIQFQVMSKMLAIILDLKGPSATVTAAAIIVLYSAFGGVRSVTITDVFQLVVFSILLPMLGLTIWNGLEDNGKVISVVTEKPIFSLQTIINWDGQSLYYWGLMLYYAIPGMQPPIFQRIVMASDTKQVKQAFNYAAGIILIIVLVVAWIAILLLADNDALEPKKLVYHLLDTYAYPGFRGLMTVGIMALAMSTADSILNASAVLAVNDIAKPIFPSFNVSVTAARVCSVGIGALALLLALREGDMLSLVLRSSSFYMPIVTVPLLMAVFGFRSSPRAALVGMSAGFLVASTWNLFFANIGLQPLIPGVLANLLGLMGTHYLLGEEGGWKTADKKPDTPPLNEQQEVQKNSWDDFVQGFKNPLAYLANYLPTNEGTYALFGVYVICATYFVFLTVPAEVVEAYPLLYKHLTDSVIVTAALFISYPIWPSTFKIEEIMACAWPIGISYLLFATSATLIVLSGFHQMQVTLFVIHLILVALLISWPLLLLVAASGVLIAVGLFYLYVGAIPWHHTTPELHFRLVYALPMTIGLVIAIYRYKQTHELLVEREGFLEKDHLRLEGLHYEDREVIAASFVESMAIKHALREAKADELGEIVHAGRAIYRKIEAAVEEAEYVEIEEIQPVLEEFKAFDKRLTHTATHLVDLADRAEYVALELEEISVEEFLQKIEEGIQFSRKEKYTTVHNRSQATQVQCDVKKIGRMLMDSVKFIRTYAPEKAPIQLVLEDTKLHYPLNSVHNQTYVKEIDALRWTITVKEELPALPPSYTAKLAQKETLSTVFPEQEEVIVNSKRLVNAHYGYWEIAPETLMYVIPVELSRVRPKDMDLLDPKLYTKKQRADDTYPGAKEQEEALLKAVAERSNADLELVRDAIELIKDYHGPVKRRSGEPFYLHPIAVAQIVLDYNQDEATLLGALLHDTVEDTELSLEQVETRYNKEVRQIVDGVTHLDSAEGGFHRIKLEDNENILQLLGGKDRRILYVKIADRMHNMRTIQFKKYPSQLNKANETVRFFVPLCRELGLEAAAQELENLCAEVFNRGHAPVAS